MIQFNLLPDVKLEYIKSRRSKRMVLLVAAGAGGFALFVVISLFLVVNVFQTQHIQDVNDDIAKHTATLKAIPSLDKILTIQNQLGTLTSLHEQKPAASRLFGYLTQLTPAKATISSVKLNFEDNTITLNGNADSLATVNKYVDTLKFTTYSVNGEGANKVFSDVVLSSFSTGDKGDSVTYGLTASFDSAIFDNTKQVALTTPKIISTRSETEKPTDLFQADTTKKAEQ